MKTKAVFVAVALVLSLAISGCGISVVSGERTEERFSADGISVIRIYEDAQSVRVVSSESDEISVVYYQSAAKAYSLEAAGGELAIRGETVAPAVRINKGATEIALPSSFAGVLYVETGTGSCDICVDGALSEVQVKVTTGEITVDELCADRISLTTVTGSISGTIKGNEADYSVSAHCAMGNNSLKNREGAVAGKVLNADVTTGSISLRFTSGNS